MVKTNPIEYYLIKSALHKLMPLIVSLLMIMHYSSLSSQNIDAFVEMAYEVNPKLQAQALEYEAATHNAQQVSDFPDPSISAGLGIAPIQTRLGAQFLRLGISQNIPWKGLIPAKSDLANAQASTKLKTKEVTKIEIAYAIRRSYYTLCYIQENIDIINRKIEILKSQMEIARTNLGSSQGMLSDVLMIEKKLENARQDILLLQNKMDQPTIILNRWAGRPAGTPIEIVPEEFSEDIIPDLSYDLAQHPQFDILQQQKEVAVKAVEVVRLEEKPKIMLGLDYGLISARTDVDIPNNGRDIIMPMATFSIPLNADRLQAKQHEATLTQQSINSFTEELTQQYNQEIQTALSEISYQEAVMNKITVLKELTAATMEQMQAEFASDKKKITAILNLEIELIDYDREMLQARFEKHMANAILKKYNYE